MIKNLKNRIKRLFKKRNQIERIRRCKKCGAELASKTKGSLCLNCKQKRIEKWKQAGGGICALAITLLSAGTIKKFKK